VELQQQVVEVVEGVVLVLQDKEEHQVVEDQEQM
jgi:hypothetical protein